MNTTTFATDTRLTNETSSTESYSLEQQAAIRELAELELICVGGGSGDVIF